MKIKLTNNWAVEFIDGSSIINTNDVLWHKLLVYPTPPLTDHEKMYVVFSLPEQADSHTIELVKNSASGQQYFSLTIPTGITKIPGNWQLQLLTRTYNADKTKYMEKASVKATFTVSLGLPIDENGEMVTAEQIQDFFDKVNALSDAALPEVSTADEGKFLRVVDGVWTATSVPSAETESF